MTNQSNEEYINELDLKLAEAMLLIDDYLNAGNKDARRSVHNKAKILYKRYYKKEFVNHKERP